MATTKKSAPAAKAEKEEQVININLESFIMPFAIILSTLIFSTSFLISINKLSKSISGEITVNDNSRDDNTADTVDTNPTAANPTGTTNIDNDAVLGDVNSAKIAIVEFTDFECPFCQRHHQQTFPDIVKNYVDTGKAVYVIRDFPLSFHQPAAGLSANAAECVKDLKGDKAYFDFVDQIFEKTATNGAGLGGKDALATIASDLGVNKSDFTNCLDTTKFQDEIDNDTSDGTSAGVTGTPGFIIGVFNKDDGSVTGVNIAGAQPYSVFEQEIKAQLEKAN